MSVRHWLYRLAKALGDARAVQTGRVGRRLVRRVVWRQVGKTVGRRLNKWLR